MNAIQTLKRAALGAVPGLCILAAACTHDIPAHSARVYPDVQPVQPVNTQPVQPVYPLHGQPVIIPAHRATPPVATIVTSSRANPSVSAIPLTLTGDLTPLERIVRTSLPESFNEVGHPLSSDFRWNFVRSGEPQVVIQDGMITMRGDYVGSIETKGVTARACRLNPVYPVIEETAQLDVRQIGDNAVIGLVNPRMRVWLKPESDARCNMFNVPLAEQVRELINADIVHARMTNAIEQTGMRIRADGLYGPFAYAMQPANARLCVYPAPQQVTVGTLEGNQHQAVLRTMAVVSPTAVVGGTCPPASVSPVPVRVGPVPPEQPLTIVSGVLLPYETLSDTVESRLRFSEIQVGPNGETVQIERVRASDASGRVLYAIDTNGYLRGTLYFWGTPQLQTQPNGRLALSIPDLRLDPESRRMLDTIDPALGSTFEQKMTWKVRDASNVDLSDRIAMVQTAVASPFQTGDMTVTLTPVSLRPGEVYSTPQGLVTDVTMEATGNAVGKFYIVQG